MIRAALLLACLALSGCIVVPVSESTAAKLPFALRIGSEGAHDAETAPRPLPASARCAPAPTRDIYAEKIIAGANALRAAQGVPALRRSAVGLAPLDGLLGEVHCLDLPALVR